MIIAKQTKRVLKLAVSAVLLALLLFMIDWGAARAALQQMPVAIVGCAFVIFAMQFVISAWKWRASLLAQNVRIPFAFLVRTYCVGAFFSSFLPSNVGGDIYRTFRTSDHCSVPIAMFAVILERLLGLVALVLLGVVGALWLLMSSERISMSMFVTAAAVVALAYFAVPLLVLNTIKHTGTWSRWIPARLNSVIHGLHALDSNRLRVLELLGICLLFQVVATLAVALLFVGAGAHWIPAESAVANAAGSLAAILPISINGLGITEASFAGVASQLGVDFTTATLVSFLVRILVLPLVLAFGILYMFETKVAPDEVAVTMKTEKPLSARIH